MRSGRLSAASSSPIERSGVTSIWFTRTTDTCVRNLPRKPATLSTAPNAPAPSPPVQGPPPIPLPRAETAVCSSYHPFPFLVPSLSFERLIPKPQPRPPPDRSAPAPRPAVSPPPPAHCPPPAPAATPR